MYGPGDLNDPRAISVDNSGDARLNQSSTRDSLECPIE